MAWYDKAIKNMDANTKYSRQELISIIRENTPSLNDNSYQWAVGGMLKYGEIIRIGYDEYMLPSGNNLTEYIPDYSPYAIKLMDKIDKKFPDIKFTIFETVLMNDFLNHLIAQNTIFVQVEKDVSAFVFRFLQDEGVRNIMYKPTKKDLNLYWEPNLVIVMGMVSEPPKSSCNSHFITIEKMLVDIYCDKLILSTYSIAEYPSVLDRVVKTYKVERHKMLRYARRRNKATEIKNMLTEIESQF